MVRIPLGRVRESDGQHAVEMRIIAAKEQIPNIDRVALWNLAVEDIRPEDGGTDESALVFLEAYYYEDAVPDWALPEEARGKGSRVRFLTPEEMAQAGETVN